MGMKERIPTTFEYIRKHPSFYVILELNRLAAFPSRNNFPGLTVRGKQRHSNPWTLFRRRIAVLSICNQAETRKVPTHGKQDRHFVPEFVRRIQTCPAQPQVKLVAASFICPIDRSSRFRSLARLHQQKAGRAAEGR